MLCVSVCVSVCVFTNCTSLLCVQNLNSTSRGCLTTNREINNCVNEEQKCTWCDVNESGACNTAEFPIGRRKCLHCDSSTDKTCPANVTNIATKSIYCNNIHDLCIVINKGNQGGLLQTCVEKISDKDNEFCIKNNGSCIVCNENNCNWKKPTEPSSCNRINAMHVMTMFAISIFGMQFQS